MRYTYKLKELAKDLCEKSGCHHKCNDTTDCVVEEEALLLITENKSNNFDVKSNNLPSTLKNEEKVSVKEKQIEEMARTLCGEKEQSCAECESCYRCEFWHECSVLHHAGYRKQSEVAIEIANGIINEILPKHLYGHNEKALELSLAISNFIMKYTKSEDKG